MIPRYFYVPLLLLLLLLVALGISAQPAEPTSDATLVVTAAAETERLTAASPAKNNVVPGDPAWLGVGEMMDDAPLDFAAHLPLLYVIMGEGAVAIPRVIIEHDQECPPRLVLLPSEDGTKSIEGEIDIPEVTLRGVGDMELPFAFPIKICETRLETNKQKDAWSSGLLAFEGLQQDNIIRIPTDPQRVLLIADTGLRVKATNLGLGKCNGTKLYGIPQCVENFTQADLDQAGEGSFQGLDNWTLLDLMARAAETRPDLVAIMGDYVYRQSPCPANSTANADCAAINIPANFATNTSIPSGTIVNFVPGHWGDNWFGWWADFFFPALPLLKSAPIIAVRGNHENCARAGHGYLFLMDQAPYNGTDAGSYCLDYTAPYHVPFKNEQFLVMDDSFINPLNGGIDHFNFTNGTCPQAPTDESLIVPTSQNPYLDPKQDNATNADLAQFTTYMEKIRNFSLSHETNFYLSHRPVFAVACDGSEMTSLDWTIQQSLAANTLDRVVAMIGGHMHWLEALSFVNQSLPVQLVLGHGGTDRIPNYVNQDIFPYLQLQVGQETDNGSTLFQGRVEKGISDSRMFGFALMDRNTDTKNYDVTFLSLNRTTSIPKLVELEFQLTIKKGPRVTNSDTTRITHSDISSAGGRMPWGVGTTCTSFILVNSLVTFGAW
eukprot:CAMPEP_0198288844 /NCGR_PEP_ID=MMETSP1449-20131203/7220_1 /TAXON_ID=420275 /ORGANISM="Attheya septentrionalis, Strain CCMP2084" /LENGTH=662 /DNA_ID=CAMNT_0043987061 /DNA_START=151 /DNA_END=2136 /DNA_ORIENTATION=+